MREKLKHLAKILGALERDAKTQGGRTSTSIYTLRESRRAVNQLIKMTHRNGPHYQTIQQALQLQDQFETFVDHRTAVALYTMGLKYGVLLSRQRIRKNRYRVTVSTRPKKTYNTQCISPSKS